MRILEGVACDNTKCKDFGEHKICYNEIKYPVCTLYQQKLFSDRYYRTHFQSEKEINEARVSGL